MNMPQGQSMFLLKKFNSENSGTHRIGKLNSDSIIIIIPHNGKCFTRFHYTSQTKWLKG